MSGLVGGGLKVVDFVRLTRKRGGKLLRLNRLSIEGSFAETR